MIAWHAMPANECAICYKEYDVDRPPVKMAHCDHRMCSECYAACVASEVTSVIDAPVTSDTTHQ